ncbi:hypothetical protein CP965_01940 [Halarcobacter mediterraneus]|uniref:Uncharacterized protein n=1 Tax=Halarcobacter mediterraneus TaxID=2023153 RepID=A0A4Q1AZT4_9BACT|nr:hypothetical protein [Halarcobacter mediterraneus]RXK14232.1 hypothetical protein CP965_01940 [Halarcobacter mediterraneus]
MSSHFHSKFIEYTRNMQDYLAITASGTNLIYNHKLDQIELYSFIYNTELTSSDVARILNIQVDTSSEFGEEEIVEERDDAESKTDYFFALLKERRDLFEEDYPFIIENDYHSIKLKPSLTNKQKIYIVLLCSSNLKRFKEFQKDLTNDFEKISYYSFQNKFGGIGIVKEFGNNEDYDENKTKDKIISLASELNVKPRTDVIERHISTYSTKDRGLDLAVWSPFKDKIPNMFIMLVQCASGANWKTKLAENRKICTFLDVNKTILNFGFAIPFEFSNFKDEFEFLDDIESSESIIFDRSRILESIKEENVVDSFQIIDKILETNFHYE